MQDILDILTRFRIKKKYKIERKLKRQSQVIFLNSYFHFYLSVMFRCFLFLLIIAITIKLLSSKLSNQYCCRKLFLLNLISFLLSFLSLLLQVASSLSFLLALNIVNYYFYCHRQRSSHKYCKCWAFTMKMPTEITPFIYIFPFPLHLLMHTNTHRCTHTHPYMHTHTHARTNTHRRKRMFVYICICAHSVAFAYMCHFLYI